MLGEEIVEVAEEVDEEGLETNDLFYSEVINSRYRLLSFLSYFVI